MQFLLLTKSTTSDVFEGHWIEFLEAHPAIQKMVDPIYISFTFPGGVTPPGFGAHIAACDPRAAVAEVVCPGGALSTSTFIVASRDWASYVAGRMCGLFPGVFCHRMVTTTPAISF